MMSYPLEKKYSPHQFAIWRILLGTYLVYYLMRIFPHATELYSNEGVIPDPTLNWAYGFFPNILYVFDSPEFVQAFFVVLIVAAFGILLGVHRRISAAVLWYGWAALLGRNVLTIDPSMAFIGWILFALILIPVGEPLTLRIGKWYKVNNPHRWFMPSTIYWGSWILIGAAYTVSGLDKFRAISWQNGLALQYMYERVGNKGPVVDFLLSQPLWTIKIQSWIAAGVQAAALPLMIFRQTRMFIWILVMGMFIFTLFVFTFLMQVLLGILIFQLFLFNSTWFRGKPYTVFFDDTCNVCNGYAKFLLTEDLNKEYKIGGFSGEAIKHYLSQEEIKEMKTMVAIDSEGNVLRESEAAIRSISGLCGMWKIALVAYVLPQGIRDELYRKFSDMRYKLFGTRNTCSIEITTDNRFLS